MKISVHDLEAPETTELAAVFACEGARPELPPGVKISDTALSDFKGEARELRLADAVAGPAKRVLLVGLGKRADVEREKLRRAAAVAVQRADAIGCAKAVLWCSSGVADLVKGARRAGSDLAEGARMGAYKFEPFKTKKKGRKLKTLAL